MATTEGGKAIPAQLKVWHKAVDLNPVAGKTTLDDDVAVTRDLSVCAHGMRSLTWEALTPSASCFLQCIIHVGGLLELGLWKFAENSANDFWRGNGIDKMVVSAYSDHDVVRCYCFYPAKKNDLKEDGWNMATTGENLAAAFAELV
ncbi:uncharacterized protein MAM_05182 [Metarhizium album ARSEF 1941]|uniref:Uncharacterized protein n=1 Tax=Metarhizium album (strain ARSEF 1941) TaxID=1081103 RepID=A0A0B2WSR1_METAS|nr:uncharacterized protein MAM_05182 [Metarhizium album ARSEF 1941]KHN97073.1 hypothetical protein MAM_05182 [Metarhizium album ARSEF 1941]